VERGEQMGISSSALATLVIAGTAIGGSTVAVLANNGQTDLNSTNISQVVTDPTGNPTTEPGTNVDTTPTTKPTPPANSPKPVPPTIPPTYGGGDDDEGDDEGDDDSSDDEGDDGYGADDENESEDD
jgi:hypothetical protein